MRKRAHTEYDIQYHIVWITKYRKKIITGKIASRLKVLLMQGCSANNAIFKRKKFKKIARGVSRTKEAILGTTFGDNICGRLDIFVEQLEQ